MPALVAGIHCRRLGAHLPDSADSYVRLIKAVDRDAFGVHLDPANLVRNWERLVDVLLTALGLAACSQGTMNNFTFVQNVVADLVAGVAFFLLTCVAILDIARKDFGSIEMKALWAFIVALVPFIGVLVYLFIGRRKGQLPAADAPAE